MLPRVLFLANPAGQGYLVFVGGDVFHLIRVLLEGVLAAKHRAQKRPLIRVNSHVVEQVVPFSEDSIALISFALSRHVLTAHEDA